MIQNYEPWDNLRAVINQLFNVPAEIAEELLEILVDQYLGWGDPNAQGKIQVLYDTLIPNISTHIVDPLFITGINNRLWQAFNTDYTMGSQYSDLFFDPSK